MKTLEFIYQETAIHFLVNPTDANVMVNATEMAKLFDKKTKYFLKTEHAKAFIEIAKRAPNGAQIIEDRGRNGIYFDRRLALKFAAWLSPEFEFWIYSKIEEITFGNYKKHWEAHARQEEAKQKMEIIKVQIIENPTSEMVIEYFKRESQFKQAKNAKTKAIQNQLKLFGSHQTTI